MTDAELIGLLERVGSGELDSTPPPIPAGLAGELTLLHQTRSLVFAEGAWTETSWAATHFERIKSISPESPLYAQACRLRILREHREVWQKTFLRTDLVAKSFLVMLADPPGSVLSKQRFNEAVGNSAESDELARVCANLIRTRLPEVYALERGWLSMKYSATFAERFPEVAGLWQKVKNIRAQLAAAWVLVGVALSTTWYFVYPARQEGGVLALGPWMLIIALFAALLQALRSQRT